MTEHLLITGGAGFIGSHLADRWLAEGGAVTVLDDLSTGRVENLRAAARHPRLRFEQGSVLDRRRVRRLVEEVDLIAHLGAVVGVRRVCERPLETLRVNAGGSEVLLEAAAELGRPTLVASSSEVYGASPRLPYREEQELGYGSPEIPRWSYAASKAAAESNALAHHEASGLEVRIVRFFNTSGPRQRPNSGMVLPRMVARALAGEPLVIYGDGQQSRCFCHVRDTVEAVVRLMREPRANGKVFNVGSAREVSIEQLAELVQQRVGRKVGVERRPYAEDFGADFVDTRRRVPCLARLRDAIHFEPATPLERLVDDVCADLSASMGAPR
ncbi:NAD-dependent epimerase/dehydratase family protein [Engelhardtia mirabilis]|uniref:dTDP-glucose 4,6-dehydratase n=1 Tax=Engelhardtia mirabilis TaxID=2528011 RepID=A0A518BLL2_9BACT|nr:dTDP-glucose 4,6-dehydratase [Planctomycetes bacterium Pla133]QDV02169.1 dTDP-glucose 4,6-dehydratase [Planctomycetes bacterium Pla86]